MSKVIINAKFTNMKPAHHAFIQAKGAGSNLDRAVRDAVKNLFADARLKGKKKGSLLPFTFTVAGDEDHPEIEDKA